MASQQTTTFAEREAINYRENAVDDKNKIIENDNNNSNIDANNDDDNTKTNKNNKTSDTTTTYNLTKDVDNNTMKQNENEIKIYNEQKFDINDQTYIKRMLKDDIITGNQNNRAYPSYNM